MFVIVFEDAAPMLGLIIAFPGLLISQRAGSRLFGDLASVAIGILLLGGAGIWLAAENQALLVSKAASHDDVANIREITSGRRRPLICRWRL